MLAADGSAVLSALDADEIRAIVEKVSDLAILMRRNETILDIYGKPEALKALNADRWPGMTLADAVEPPVYAALYELASGRVAARKVAFGAAGEARREFLFSATQLGSAGAILLSGRDESRLAALQNRLLEQHRAADETLERRKQVEAQYRKLFAIGAEPIVVVDAQTGVITDLNAAASTLLDVGAKDAVGRRLPSFFAARQRDEAQALFDAALATRTTETAQLTLATKTDVEVKATPSPGDGDGVLIQLNPASAKLGGDGDTDRNVLDLIREASESVVVLDEEGVIVWTNSAFANLIMSADLDGLIGRDFGAFLDANDIDLSIILANLRKHDRIRQLPTSLLTSAGERIEVELSAVRNQRGPSANFGLFIRHMSARTLSTDPIFGGGVRDQILSQLGKASLKDLVSEEVAAVERNLISAALDLTDGNRSATARLLGLSRQGLYSKLERHGLSTTE